MNHFRTTASQLVFNSCKAEQNHQSLPASITKHYHDQGVCEILSTISISIIEEISELINVGYGRSVLRKPHSYLETRIFMAFSPPVEA